MLLPVSGLEAGLQVIGSKADNGTFYYLGHVAQIGYGPVVGHARNIRVPVSSSVVSQWRIAEKPVVDLVPVMR